MEAEIMSVRYKRGDTDNRIWGTWEVLDTGDKFCVKRLVVKPGASLHLQTHAHRSEHWIVASGVACVTLGRETREYPSDSAIYIPIGEYHRLSNPGTTPLMVIEVQTGDALDENDIVHYNDDYTIAK